MKDTHDILLDQFREYFRLNMEWETRRTHAAGMRVRKMLSDIRKVASVRRQEIQAIRAEKPKLKSPEYKKSKLQGKKSQGDT